MPCVTWKPITGNYYAYLDTCRYDPEKKRPRTTGTYLGSTPEKAAAKLKALVPEVEYPHLVEQLYRKRPQDKPPQNEAGKAARELIRLKAKYRDERVQQAVNAALEILEGGTENA